MRIYLSAQSCGVLFCGAVFAGCALSKPLTEIQPQIPARAHYQQAPPEPVQERMEGPWWTSFQDPVLNELMAEAMSANLDLRVLAARVGQADALVRQARGRLFPGVNGSGSVESQSVRNGDRSSSDQSASIGGTASWELDFWGRLRAARAAREHGRAAAVQDWLGARVLLSAAVAETYFEIVEQQQQIRLAQEQIEVNDTLLDLTKLRFGQGQSSVVDVLQQQEQLASTRSRVPELESRLQQLLYGMDVLLGRAPGSGQGDREGGAGGDGGRKVPFTGRLESLPYMRRELSAPPEWPAGGVPSDLLVKRPDLVAARHLVASADAAVAEAVADRLPRFVIGGSAAGVGDWEPAALVTSAFASVAGPIFDAGVRRAEVDLRRAQVEEQLARFSGAYLAAVQEVETALVLERKQAERVRLLSEQLAVAQRLLRETRNRYSQGLTDYLPVLNAVATAQNLERALLTNRREWLERRLALHRALGGPMETEAPAL